MAFKKAGFKVSVATENGTSPECDAKMLTGWTQTLLVSISDMSIYASKHLIDLLFFYVYMVATILDTGTFILVA